MCAFFQERKIYIFQERKKKIQHLRQNVREEHANKTYLAINLSCQVLGIHVYFDLFLFRARGKKLVVIEGYSRIKRKRKRKRETHTKKRHGFPSQQDSVAAYFYFIMLTKANCCEFLFIFF